MQLDLATRVSSAGEWAGHTAFAPAALTSRAAAAHAAVALPDLADSDAAILPTNTRSLAPLFVADMLESLRIGRDLVDLFSQPLLPIGRTPAAADDTAHAERATSVVGSIGSGLDACDGLWALMLEYSKLVAREVREDRRAARDDDRP